MDDAKKVSDAFKSFCNDDKLLIVIIGLLSLSLSLGLWVLVHVHDTAFRSNALSRSCLA